MKETIETPTLTSASLDELMHEVLIRLGKNPSAKGCSRPRSATPKRCKI